MILRKSKMAQPAKNVANAAATRARVKQIITRLDKAHPDARLALDYTNPLELLVSLILAAQSHDSLVVKLTTALFAKYRTAKDYASASADELLQYIGRINFARIKAGRIKSCCDELVK